MPQQMRVPAQRKRGRVVAERTAELEEVVPRLRWSEANVRRNVWRPDQGAFTSSTIEDSFKRYQAGATVDPFFPASSRGSSSWRDSRELGQSALSEILRYFCSFAVKRLCIYCGQNWQQ